MSAPAVILFVTFVVSPFLYGLYTSFFRWDGLSEMKFIGVNNYQFVLEDEIF